MNFRKTLLITAGLIFTAISAVSAKPVGDYGTVVIVNTGGGSGR